MEATIAENKIPVRHTICADIRREFLTFTVPNGWDDVKNFVNKVLVFERREFIFSGWNSDRNEVYFFRDLTKRDIILNPDNVCWSTAEVK